MPNSFSNRLSKILQIRDIKPADLAKLTGLSRGTISSYLSGRWEAKQNNLYAIATALHVSPSWLMGYDVPMDWSPQNASSVLSDREKNLVAKYRTLNDTGKATVDAVVNVQYEILQKHNDS